MYIIRGEQAGIHPMVVWSEDRNIRSEHFLMVLCVFDGIVRFLRMQESDSDGTAGRNEQNEG